MEKLIIYDGGNYHEVPLSRETSYQGVSIQVKDNVVSIHEQEIQPYQITNTTLGKVLYVQENRLIVERKSTVFIGPKGADIRILKINAKMVIKGERLLLNEDIELYHNGHLVTEKTIGLQNGDILQIHTVRLELQENHIIINAREEDYQTSLQPVYIKSIYPDTFPFYSRSPRIIKKINEESIEIMNPPNEEAMNVKGVVATFTPTLLTVSVSIGVGLMMGRGPMLIMSVASSVVTFATNVAKYINDKKEMKLKNQKRRDIYQAYLLKIRKMLYHRTKYNQDVLAHNYPNLYAIQRKIESYDSRIYERTYQDEDFLEICIGHYEGKSLFAIKNTQETIELKKDDLKEQAKILQQEFLTIQKIPLSIDLKNAHLGLVGEKKYIHQQLKAYIMEMTFFHSYHELEIVSLYHSRDKEDFSYLKWYPHMRIKAMNVATNIHNERMRDQIMGSIYQILKERKNKIEENHKEMHFLPHLVFIIDEPSLIINHSIMEFLQLHRNELGYSIIYTTDKQAKLPENIKTVVAYEDSEQGYLIINEGEYLNKPFTLLQSEGIDFETNARRIAGLVHEEKMSSQIPENVGFLEMYGVEKVEALPIQKLWQDNRIYKNMAVPLGMRAKDDIVYLDLHEKAHGPHGLVAGTTGSGKSEIVQSYILSLAINFHPHDVGFLLIDYKGGGMANLFKELPHLLGTITNLDGSESMRALVSIQSELKRRQRVFEQAGVNNINAYTKLFKNGETKEPLPHLFIISDEFAELKKEQPEFMKELVSTARVGRSLGVHLILATQKPSGVVDDQIWSNSKFKLCLKVQNEADSKEMLKTPDAANITQAGRSYLQVGNNEIYELFQSAYSGGSYAKRQEEVTIDNRVFLINELGQGQVVNEDLSGNQHDEHVKVTQLDKIVSHIHKIYEGLDAVEVKKPWLPALPTRVVLPLEEVVEEMDLSCEIGLVDIPKQQLQKPYSLDLQKEGNIAYFASSGYGKTMFLSTIMTSLARKNMVERVNFYILDFGNNALIPFNNMSHTADYITFDDEERFAKFIKLVQEEMKTRKQLIASHQTQNFTLHNRTSEKKIRAIVILVDQFDVMKEKGIEVETFFSKLARDGSSLGIYLVLTGSRQADVRYATLNQIKTKIAGYLFDAAEISQVVGRSEWKIPDIKGRMLVKMDEVHTAQMYLPIAFEDEVEYLDNVKELVNRINDQNKGSKAKRIAVLPEQLFYHDLVNYDWDIKESIALGLDKETVKIKGLTLTNEPFLIIGPQRCGKTNALKMVYNQTEGKKYMFDTSKMNFNFVRSNKDTIYVYEQNGYQQIFTELKEETNRRKEEFDAAYKSNSQLIPQEFYRELSVCTCFIDDIEYFHGIAKLVPEVATLLPQAVECGIRFVVCEDSTKSSAMNASANVFRRTGIGLVLGSCVMSNPFNISMQQAPQFGDGLLLNMNGRQSIKMAKFDEK